MVAALFMAGVLIVGDSISAHPQGWANILRDENPNIQVMAMSGRTIRDFSLPRDLVAGGQIDTVIYWLGINDAYSGYPVRYVHRFMSTQLNFLMSRGFRTIVLVPPYSSAIGQPSEDLRTMFHKYCELRESWARLECYEVAPWAEERTIDTIHPTLELHYDIAMWMTQEVL